MVKKHPSQHRCLHRFFVLVGKKPARQSEKSNEKDQIVPKCRDGGNEAGGRGTDYRSTREHLPQLHLPYTLYHRHLPPPLDSSNSCCRLPKLGKLRDKGPVLLRGLSIKSSHRVNLSQFPKSSWPVNSNPHPYWPEKTASPLTQGD